MGVSGSGKPAVTNEVAHQLQVASLDGDFLRPRSNIMKIASGESLDDDGRKPRLQALNDAAFAMQRANEVSLIACSILKKVCRDQLHDGNLNLSSIYPKGDFDIIESRLRARKGRLFETQMLVTRLKVLEEPGASEDGVLVADIDQLLNGMVVSTIEVISQGSKQ